MLDTLAHIWFAASWKALLLAGGVWLIARLTPLRRRPAGRHALWTVASVALLCLPMLQAFQFGTPAAEPLQIAVAIPAAASIADTPVATAHSTPESALPSVVAALYLLGLAVALARLLFGWRACRRFRAAARTLSGERGQAILRSVAARAGLGQSPPLLESGRFGVPVTAGLLRPAIVLPRGQERWQPSRLEAVLAHECAHIARHDTRTAALIALSRAVYWFHPVAWPLGRHAARLMEQACDDFAIRLLGDRQSYASALLATASLQSTAEPRDEGALAMASHLSSRIDRILAGLSCCTGVLRARSLAALAAAVAAVTVMAALLTPVWAQQSGVTLSGVVVDASGARIPGVAVIVRDPARNVTEAVISGDDGAFAIRGLTPSADYALELDASGFASSNQTVSLPQDAAVEVELQVGRIREEIVVEAEAPEQTRTAARAPQRIRVGGNVQRANLSRAVQPEYPEQARAEGVEGTVLLEAVIGASGQPVSLSAVNNLVDSRLVAAATDAVSQWRYEPTLLNGQPVEVATTITVGFRLRR